MATRNTKSLKERLRFKKRYLAHELEAKDYDETLKDAKSFRFMKTLYTTSGKFVVQDETLSLADAAVTRAEAIAQENSWRVFIEIDVPETRHDQFHPDWAPGCPTGQVIVRIGYDNGIHHVDDNQIFLALTGKVPRKDCRVDIGEYSYAGWESLIDSKDLREIPDIYFSERFVNRLTEPKINERASRSIELREVDQKHWRNLSLRIYSMAKQKFFEEKGLEGITLFVDGEKVPSDTRERLTDWYKNVLVQARRVYTGLSDSSYLVKAINSCY